MSLSRNFTKKGEGGQKKDIDRSTVKDIPAWEEEKKTFTAEIPR
jgi:hypothetical protein